MTTARDYTSGIVLDIIILYSKIPLTPAMLAVVHIYDISLFCAMYGVVALATWKALQMCES